MEPTDEPRWSPSTLAVTAGRPPHAAGAPVNPDVQLSSTYVADGPLSYGRDSNPVWEAYEAAHAALEGGDAVLFSSGMASISAAVALVPDGSRVVVGDRAYSGTFTLLDDAAAQGRLDVVRVPSGDTSAFAGGCKGAALVWVESPANPTLEVVDTRVVAAAAHDAGALVVADATFSTPLGHRFLDDGVDVVVHSVTKYLAGHSDVLLGVAATRDPALLQRLRTHRTRHGAIPGPWEAWLALRGLRTLPVRWERSCHNAGVLAGRLARHRSVARVRYPGSGAVVSFEPRGDAASAERICAAVRLWTHATSLGGVESTLERRRRHVVEVTGVPEALIRLSVGIEDVEDLWRDLSAALDAVLPDTRFALRDRPEQPSEAGQRG